MASVEVIQYSSSDLYRGFVLKDALVIQAPPLMYIILGSGTAAKIVLYYYCKQFKDSDSLAALAEDHLNDVLSNLAAIVTASIAAHIRKLWWIDPIGGHVLSPIEGNLSLTTKNLYDLLKCSVVDLGRCLRRVRAHSQDFATMQV